MFPADSKADRHDKATAAFRNFAIASKSIFQSQLQIRGNSLDLAKSGNKAKERQRQRKERNAALNNKTRYYYWFTITYIKRDVHVPQVQNITGPIPNNDSIFLPRPIPQKQYGACNIFYKMFRKPSPVDLLWTPHPRRCDATYTK